MIRTAEEFIKLRDANDPRAMHDKALKSVWLTVIKSYPEYKEWVIHNKTVPVSILRLLASDADPQVRFWVATKRKCDAKLFELLARDKDDTVRGRVAWNATTPLAILEMLKDDPCEDVAEVVAGRLKIK